MTNFPNTFAETTQPLSEVELDPAGHQAVQLLAEKGYEVHVGLTPQYAKDIMAMTLEPAIREYCPNDSGSRFTDLAATERWLSKHRAAFLLLKRDNGSLRLAGYGWAGLGGSSQVPDGETTFAIRIGEVGQGQGLATPFSQLIIAGSVALYGAKNFWLETWASNGAAVHVYHKVGFVDRAEVPGERITASGETVADTRFFMSLPS